MAVHAEKGKVQKYLHVSKLRCHTRKKVSSDRVEYDTAMLFADSIK